MKKTVVVFLVFLFLSCKNSSYVFVDSKPQVGLDFSKGKWLLNELDCTTDAKDQLTAIVTTFFSKKVKQRFSYIKNEKQLLVAQRSYFGANKSILKELKKGTGFDYLINVVTKNNRSEMASLQLYQKEASGTNESEVVLEIVDLNTQEVVFKEHVIGKFQKKVQKSMWDDPKTMKSTRLLDNININTTTNKLVANSLQKILKKLDKNT